MWLLIITKGLVWPIYLICVTITTMTVCALRKRSRKSGILLCSCIILWKYHWKKSAYSIGVMTDM